jgi:hypothetical protein
VKRTGFPFEQVGELSSRQARGAMMTIASMQKTTVTELRPVLETQLPIWKYRFAGLIEPVVLSPSFAIRVKSDKKRSLRDLQRQGILTTKDDPRNRRSQQEDFIATVKVLDHLEIIQRAILAHKNILIVGGTGAGKTTIANAILEEIGTLTPADRVLVFEDTQELLLDSANSLSMLAIQSALLNARAAQGVGAIPQPASPPAPSPNSLPEQRTDYERQNDQEQKAGFGPQHGNEESEYLGRDRRPALGNYEIKAGWLIPAVLEQQLNSDLPGLIRALVRENVYDTVTGRYILLPAGSTLVGIYNSHVGYGQSALQAVWRRVIFPDGSSLSLGGFEGDDSTGAAGFRDQVDNHWGRILSGALLTSLFAAASS